ncbi:MAG TPA: 6,7-dimethyl-8-ribityllumazine synthase [Candidatus Cloacimonadota bacterium]|nr:6,7-dimethyl-8-ribityllumazine synthase [Candidatus Cloacimonadota bacterium]HPT72288.1 6,7-dimethyl-8-ribityllumazine synthase [Candidatus Cloacimonadota bacterium]
MAKIVEGKLISKGFKYALVVSRFNEFISNKLLEGAMDCLLRHGVMDNEITVIWTSGAFEIPPVAQKAAKSKKYNAVVCLGAVIRGATPHFEYVSAEVSKGIANAAMNSDVPIIYGVLTTDSIEQAIERAGTKAGNKGWDAALAAIEMINLFKEIS